MAKLPSKRELIELVGCYAAKQDEFDLFRRQVADFFQTSRHFLGAPLPLVHSVKSRLKSHDHLLEKIKRKWSDGKITPDNLFSVITDLAGVRVLHLHTGQFEHIHNFIKQHVDAGYWTFAEAPTAYSWDPEATAKFESFGITTVTRESYYTSIHYVVKPHANTDLACEIQVRTLFEEAWGEIDHALNYPKATGNLACKEQLRVLAKLASTGTRLADAIFNTHALD